MHVSNSMYVRGWTKEFQLPLYSSYNSMVQLCSHLFHSHRTFFSSRFCELRQPCQRTGSYSSHERLSDWNEEIESPVKETEGCQPPLLTQPTFSIHCNSTGKTRTFTNVTTFDWGGAITLLRNGRLHQHVALRAVVSL